MRFVPAILIILSFVIICIGVYLKANVLIWGGLIGEGIFIMLNRYVMRQERKNK